MPKLVASVQEHGEFIYITTPLSLFAPDQSEIETFAFAADLRAAAPNPNLLWLKGQYVEADNANSNGDQWTAGDLAIKALTPVLCPVTVMHDLRSAVGTIADARLMLPDKDNVPRARIDTSLAIWEHRFPEIAEESRVNASQGTLTQSMECLSGFFDCSFCGKMMQRTRTWQSEWREHVAGHADSESLAVSGGKCARILRAPVFTGVGLIFGTRGARGAMPTAHLEVEELAAMHREAHEGSSKSKRPRRKNTVEIEDSKYEALVSAKSEGETKVADLTARLAAIDEKLEKIEADKVAVEEARDAEKVRADAAEEAQRVAAMKDERMGALGAGFLAKLTKMEATAARVKEQAAKLDDGDWIARLVELEELLGVKRDAAAEGGTEEKKDTTAGLLFDRKDVAASAVGSTAEVTASAAGEEPSRERRQTVMAGLIRKPREKARA
jgi:hypothetical protein